jgi:ribosomal protein L40E
MTDFARSWNGSNYRHLMGFALIFLGSLLALAYVLWPFWHSRFADVGGLNPADSLRDRVMALERQKLQALAAIREAEFDLKMNKLTPEDFEIIRRKYAPVALAAIEELSQLGEGNRPKDLLTRTKNLCARCGATQITGARFCFGCGTGLVSQRATRSEDAGHAMEGQIFSG